MEKKKKRENKSRNVLEPIDWCRKHVVSLEIAVRCLWPKTLTNEQDAYLSYFFVSKLPNYPPRTIQDFVELVAVRTRFRQPMPYAHTANES